MAEVRKNKKIEKYNLDEMTDVQVNDSGESKATKKDLKKKNNKKSDNKNKDTKKSLWVRFRIFCHGVKSEFNKVHWTSKADLVKYSIATIVFVIFLAIFFYLIDIIFAFIQSLLG